MNDSYLLANLLLPELEIESAKTRRLFEALPEGQNQFRPYPKSMTLERLASHTTDLYRFMALSLSSPDLDWAAWTPFAMTTKASLLATHAENTQLALKVLRQAADPIFGEPWRVFRDGKDLFHGKRYDAYRFNGMNQMVHHRAQLGTYIRALDHPLPGMYGPSADGIDGR